MFLELSEIFVCPDCRPAQGLVVLVDEIRERRVLRGHLGCPGCELRVPIRDGVLRFDRAPGAEGPGGDRDAGPGAAAASPEAGGTAPPEAGPLADVGPEEAATRLAALLGADAAEGCLLLGPGLARLAAPLARLAREVEVLALAAGPGEGGAPREEASRAVGVRPRALPVVTGRLSGAALLRPGPDEVREAVRVLREGGRLVLLEPAPGAAEALEGEPVRVVAAEEDAVVAVREPGAATARP